MESLRCIVQGATGGIGSALCRQLAAGGAQLAVAGRDDAKVRALAEEVGGEPLVYDATDAGAVADAVEQATAVLGGLNGAVNCVGSILLKPAHTTTDEEFRRTIDLNLGTAFSLLRCATKGMPKGGGGSIVLVSSAVARHGFAAHEAIAAAKAGVIGLALAGAASYASRGVRINVVAPGLTDTPMASGITSNEAALKASLAMTPDGALGDPAEVARAMAFLLDPANSHITGQVLAIDGGLGSMRAK
ncbi:MAG: SDR family oxidoreductase [Planctomycetota bacterium]